jgi:hypothetical protein
VRAVFFFAPTTNKTAKLPRMAPSACNIAFVDVHTRFPKPSNVPELGWQLRRLSEWPFPGDAPRTAHFLKVAAPLIFPQAVVVLAADIKCVGGDGGLPCALMRPREPKRELARRLGTRMHSGEGNVSVHHVRVAKNRWYKARSVEGEFVHTWKHMRQRRMPASTFREINEQLSAYEREGFDMHPLYRLPDTFCIGTDVQSPLAREFACRLAREVAVHSMREQLSFDHARPEGLAISWWAMTTINQHSSAACILPAAVPPGGVEDAHISGRALVSVARRKEVRVGSSRNSTTQRHHARNATSMAHRHAHRAGEKAVVEVDASMPVAVAHAQTALAPAASARPATLHHALVMTGLRRSFDEIGDNVRSRIFGFLRGTGTHVRIRRFGVRPTNDSWAPIVEKLGPFDALEQQMVSERQHSPARILSL